MNKKPIDFMFWWAVLVFAFVVLAFATHSYH
jgi:hypothetical protein